MSTTKFLSSEQVARIWTLYCPATIRELARKGELPVVAWFGEEPVFERNEKTIRAMLRLSHGNSK